MRLSQSTSWTIAAPSHGETGTDVAGEIPKGTEWWVRNSNREIHGVQRPNSGHLGLVYSQ